jgi:hypothetical protein
MVGPVLALHTASAVATGLGLNVGGEGAVAVEGGIGVRFELAFGLANDQALALLRTALSGPAVHVIATSKCFFVIRP